MDMNSDNSNSHTSISTSAPLFSSFPFLPELESFFYCYSPPRCQTQLNSNLEAGVRAPGAIVLDDTMNSRQGHYLPDAIVLDEIGIFRA